MTKKLLIGSAIFGLSILLIAMLVPTVMAAEEAETVWEPTGNQKGFGPKDDDEDGIPNGQDSDFVPDENCTEDGPHGEAKESKNGGQGNNSDPERPEDGSGSMKQYKGKTSDTGSGSKGSGDRLRVKDESCME